MLKKKLIWQLYPSYLLITLAALFVVTTYVTHAFRSFYLQQKEAELTRLAYVIKGQIVQDGHLLAAAQVGRLCNTYAEYGQGDMPRVTVILPSGKVIGDSKEDIKIMENHANRPEFIQALDGQVGTRERKSPTLGINMKYVALAAEHQGVPLAVVRTAESVSSLENVLSRVLWKTTWCGLVVAGMVAMLSLVVSRRLTQPIEVMQTIAQRFSEGDFSPRVPIWSTHELKSLALTLNKMAWQLDGRIRMVTSQRNELEAILTSMIEGVIAVDREGHVVRVNRAAAQFLNIDPEQAQGHQIEEVIRDVELQSLVIKTLEGTQVHEGSLSLPLDGGLYFQVHGVRLPDDGDQPGGAVIVLNDVTRIHRLEGVRRDFVANVSHELKTPITSIKGFVEALIETGFEDKDQSTRYLGIVAKHADRLNAIIDDLLILSRLEENAAHRGLSFEPADLCEVVQSAVELSSLKALEKSVTLDVACDSVTAMVNAPLLEQAVVNLIDNAIKYSDTGTQVTVRVQKSQDCICIAVSDQGCGISGDHLGRLFERFYVVDKGRSRKLGGTGLGLAIVKHIAQVHGARVDVTSQVGQGSTFTIELPLQGQNSDHS
ncbi:MAG: PAS domain-containing protein [Phycisphaerae bacterium]|nr:PAS domain-containing protein [Phycisphaerae bacterium]